MKAAIAILFFIILAPHPAWAEADSRCLITDRPCLLKTLKTVTSEIEDVRWRDQTYREVLRHLAATAHIDDALDMIGHVENPDTRAMTIRGIGMEIARMDMDEDQRHDFFQRLMSAAETIEHEASHAIAYTYIAMAQAFAGDNEAALRTANTIENTALRNKAHAEAAEIQAERGDITALMTSIDAIDDAAFRNKALYDVSRILATQRRLEDALDTAYNITNPYQQAQAMLHILEQQIAVKP